MGFQRTSPMAPPTPLPEEKRKGWWCPGELLSHLDDCALVAASLCKLALDRGSQDNVSVRPVPRPPPHPSAAVRANTARDRGANHPSGSSLGHTHIVRQ